jgi:CBS domain-containing protein
VARQVASYNLLAIPVVDEENKLVGVITVDDVIDVIKDEATEDIYRLAGVAGDERAFTPAGESLRKRLPWLGINLITAFLAASVVALFENTIDQITALAVFMPIVAGMGGNAATQTLTVIVRGIALPGPGPVRGHDHQYVRSGHGRNVDSPGSARGERRSGPGVVCLHHHADRRHRILLVSRPGDGVCAIPDAVAPRNLLLAGKIGAKRQ